MTTTDNSQRNLDVSYEAGQFAGAISTLLHLADGLANTDRKMIRVAQLLTALYATVDFLQNTRKEHRGWPYEEPWVVKENPDVP